MLLHQLAAPAKIYIDITAKCNLRCIYCYHFDSPSAVLKDCSTAEWTSFIEEASRAGVMSFNISGGEALLRLYLKSWRQLAATVSVMSW